MINCEDHILFSLRLKKLRNRFLELYFRNQQMGSTVGDRRVTLVRVRDYRRCCLKCYAYDGYNTDEECGPQCNTTPGIEEYAFFDNSALEHFLSDADFDNNALSFDERIRLFTCLRRTPFDAFAWKYFNHISNVKEMWECAARAYARATAGLVWRNFIDLADVACCSPCRTYYVDITDDVVVYAM